MTNRHPSGLSSAYPAGLASRYVAGGTTGVARVGW
jgi:hypothetical protein